MRYIFYPFIACLISGLSMRSPVFAQERAPEDFSDTLAYSSPSLLSIDSTRLFSGIETIISQAIEAGAFPGCQILLAQCGQIFYYESFGYHTYDSALKVQNTDLYDLASITKTAAATLALMKLYEEGRLDIDRPLSYFFPFLRRSDKANLPLRKVLAHQSRLKNWIPFYETAKRKNGKYKSKTFSSDSSASFPDRVPGSDLFIHKDYKTKKIYRMIEKSALYEKEEFVYSGLAFYLIPELISNITGMKFDDYLNHEFYRPLGAATLGFEPSRRFPSSRIVPTEIDTFFRQNLLHGVVHDEGAATMLGISGNAGLFANAYDLAQLYQMLLNGGHYRGKQWLKKATIDEFTQCQYCPLGNRRGLGFDKPLIQYDSLKSSVARAASASSYGHSGYTGTLVWADPENQLLFVFLSNRVHPDRNNKKIYELNVRPNIHNMVYDLMEEGRKTQE